MTDASGGPRAAISARDFVRWLELMGFTDARASKTLGMSRNTIARYRQEGGPLSVAYACAAISHGLKPWPAGDQVTHRALLGVAKVLLATVDDVAEVDERVLLGQVRSLLDLHGVVHPPDYAALVGIIEEDTARTRQHRSIGRRWLLDRLATSRSAGGLV